MTYNKLWLATATLLLLTQCDPTKKVYNPADYTGQIDTSYTPSYEDYGEPYGEDYEYGYDNDVTPPADEISPWSTDIYRATEPIEHDLIHTKLEVSFDWGKTHLLGKATLELEPYFYPSGNLTLDAKGMDIHEVALLKGNVKTSLLFTYDSSMLFITLDKVYQKGEKYQVFIQYTAKPNELPEGGSAAITGDKGLYFINPDGKEPNKPMQIWTQGETEASSCWFPTIDQPNQRTTQSIYITIEDRFTTLSNGVLVSSTQHANGTRTDYWEMNLPHAPYLFMMAIGEYAIVKDTWKNKDVTYYVEKEYEPYARDIFGNTPEMLTFFSDVLGVEYPWQKYAQVIVRDFVSGAMENTTATIHGEFVQQTDREILDESWEDIVAHELIHQWFGNLVTTESWSNLPLNESFATYGEYLWREYKYGREEADQHLLDDLNNYLYEASSKQVDMIRFNYENKDDMFDSHSYAKGGCILHMLRKEVGDEAFFSSLQLYLKTNAYAPVEIHDLRLAFEKTTGRDLNWFFNQWFLSSGHPDLVVEKTYDEVTGLLTLEVEQLQFAPAPVYILPVDIDIYTQGKPTRHRVLIDKRQQQLTFNLSQEPELVVFDAENQLLATITYEQTPSELALLYAQSTLFRDRYQAIAALGARQYADAVAGETIRKALKDPYWAIRKLAVDTILIDPSNTEISQWIITMATEDPKSAVRSAAINRFGELNQPNLVAVLEQALTDSSYLVIGSALSALQQLDPAKAMEAVRPFMLEDNINLLISVWSILAESGNAKDNDYFLLMFDKYQTWETYYLMIFYQQFIQQQTDLYIIQKGVDQFKEIALDDSGNWVSFFAGSFLSGIYEHFQMTMTEKPEAVQQVWKEAMTYIEKTQEEIDAHFSSSDY